VESRADLTIGACDALPAAIVKSKWIEYEVEGYLCADCGYLEADVKSPTTANFLMIPGFRWITPQPSEEGPYRKCPPLVLVHRAGAGAGRLFTADGSAVQDRGADGP